MARKIDRARLKAFVLRRRANMMGLLAITAFSFITTIICFFCGFERTDVLSVVTACFILLCLVQMLRMKKSFRTLKAYKAVRKRKEE